MKAGQVHTMALAMAFLGATTLALPAGAAVPSRACQLDPTTAGCELPVKFTIPATTPEIWTEIDKRLADAHAASPTLDDKSSNTVHVAMIDLKKLLLALPDKTQFSKGTRADVLAAIDAAVAKASVVENAIMKGAPGAETIPLKRLDPLVDKVRAYYPDGTFKAPVVSKPTTP